MRLMVKSGSASRAPKKRWFALLAVSMAVVFAGHVAYSSVYYMSNLELGSKEFADGFEKGDLSAWRVGETEFCCDRSAMIVSSGAREGNRALKVGLSPEDPRVAGSKRAEVRLKAVELGEERWYAFSLFIPEDWHSIPEVATIAQWHAVDDKILGEVGRAPPLRLVVKGDQWSIASHWDSRRISGIPFLHAAPEGGDVLWSAPLTRGTWTDWVFHVQWSYNDDGIIEIWKDGTAIARRKGPNAYNDWLGPFFKLGIYVPHWNKPGASSPIERHEVLIDRVRQSTHPLVPAIRGMAANTRSADE
ncbi:polysaccharide lyase [Microvirga terrestris]|uniref:Polysaccharide lyase n=1 Tax=Microvirga terrestris TaxID=2791024 RepID=A0ABS0HVZ9_9HYPH|nr:polysaccharide lyase [Microvirga terrestris]MBF9197529.1 polysaccharide lyase [Microvirga terrestris]